MSWIRQSSFSRYLSQKEKAVAISAAILEVFSVRAEVRRCDRVAADIAEADLKAEELLAQFQQTEEYLEQSLAMCQKLAKPKTKIAGMEEEQLKQAKTDLQEVAQRSKEIPHQELFDQEEFPGSPEQLQQVREMNEKIDSCRESVKVAISDRKQALVAIAEETRKQQELALLAQQTQENKPETEDERMERLSKNYSYFTLVKRVAPEFPRRAMRSGSEGYVIIEYLINPEGKVFDPVVVESEPNKMFDKAAIKAIKQWQYEANFEEAEPSEALARTRMRFSLSN